MIKICWFVPFSCQILNITIYLWLGMIPHNLPFWMVILYVSVLTNYFPSHRACIHITDTQQKRKNKQLVIWESVTVKLMLYYLSLKMEMHDNILTTDQVGNHLLCLKIRKWTQCSGGDKLYSSVHIPNVLYYLWFILPPLPQITESWLYPISCTNYLNPIS